MASDSKPKRGQIAMEQLMTYSWAILIMLVVIAVLWAMGFFNARNAAPSSCILSDQLSCADFSVDASGNMHLDLGQATGRVITITGVGCGTSASPAVTQIVPVMIENKKHAWVTASAGLHCANASGEVFRGTIVIEYTAADLPFPKITKGDISAPMNGANNSGSNVTTMTPTPVPTEIIACPTIISAPGSYTLSANLTTNSNCISVTTGGSGSTIDCGGHRITGDGGVIDWAIQVLEAGNVTITNCEITNIGTAIWLRNVSTSNVTNNHVWACTNNGIMLGYSSVRNRITGNNASMNSGQGFSVDGSAHNVISGNTANNNLDGIIVHTNMGYTECPYSQNTTIQNNEVQYNTDAGVMLDWATRNNTVNGNTANRNGNYGIYFFSSANNTVSGNTARWNGQYGFYCQNQGFSPPNCTDNTLTANVLCSNNHTTNDAKCDSTLPAGSSNTCRTQSGCGITCGSC